MLPHRSFVKYCPDKVFKIDPVTDNVVVDDPLLATEFNDQMVGRKVADTGRRVMEFGMSRLSTETSCRHSCNRRYHRLDRYQPELTYCAILICLQSRLSGSRRFTFG